LRGECDKMNGCFLRIIMADSTHWYSITDDSLYMNQIGKNATDLALTKEIRELLFTHMNDLNNKDYLPK
jgi:hypothetical protein